MDVFDILEVTMTKYTPFFEQSILLQRIVPWTLLFCETTNSQVFRTVLRTIDEFFTKSNSYYSNQLFQSDMFIQIVNTIIKTALATNISGMRSACGNCLWAFYNKDSERTAFVLQNIIYQSYSSVPHSLIETLGNSHLNVKDFSVAIDDFFYICKETN